MANLLVYLQRTPQGLHPASEVAICVARDIAALRGATVTGLCPGDAGDFDEHIVRSAGRNGADVVVFTGPAGMRGLYDLLRPRHVIIPWTHEANAAVEDAALGPAVPRWVGGPQDDPDALDHVTAMVAGTLGWHAMPEQLEPEYTEDVAQVELPAWLAATEAALHSDPKIRFVAPPDLEAECREALASLGAEAVSPDYADRHESGTLLWLDAGPAGLPPALGHRPEHARVIFLPGPAAEPSESWSLSDWVLPGPWTEICRRLDEEPWRRALG